MKIPLAMTALPMNALCLLLGVSGLFILGLVAVTFYFGVVRPGRRQDPPPAPPEEPEDWSEGENRGWDEGTGSARKEQDSPPAAPGS